MSIKNSIYFNVVDDIEDVTNYNDPLVQGIQASIELNNFKIDNYLNPEYFNQLSNIRKRQLRNQYLNENPNDYFKQHRLIRFKTNSPLYNSLLDWYGRDIGLPKKAIFNNCFKFIDNFQIFDDYVYATIKVMFKSQSIHQQLKQQATYIYQNLLNSNSVQSWDYFINEFVFGKKTWIEASIQYHAIIKYRIQNAIKYNDYQFNFKNLETKSI